MSPKSASFLVQKVIIKNSLFFVKNYYCNFATSVYLWKFITNFITKFITNIITKSRMIGFINAGFGV